MKALILALGIASTALCSQPVFAQEALIRKNIAERLPNFPKIDEVNKAAVAGLYELRIGSDILYSDETGDHLFEGTILDTKSQVNLTQVRVEKLTALDFAKLPLNDAIVWTQGTGARKLVVFADPNCSYCKQFENDLLQVKDLTVYTFLLPILGGDSPEKARNIWCAKDKGSVWRDWMLHGRPPIRSMGACDSSAIARNLALGKKHKLSITPILIFEDGKRVKGVLAPELVEKQLLLSQARG